MKLRVYTGLIVVFLAGLFGFANWYWSAVLVATTAAVVIYNWKRLPEGGRKLAGLVILLLVGLTLWLGGGVPNHYNPGTSTRTRIPGLGFILNSTPPAYLEAVTPLAPDEARERREQFRKKIFELRSQGKAADRAVALMDQADEVIQKHRSTIDVTGVIGAKQEVDSVLISLGLTSGAARTERAAQLDTILVDVEKRLEEGAALDGEAYTDFVLKTKPVSFSQLDDSVLKLEDSLNNLIKASIEQRVQTSVTARGTLNEQDQTLTRDLVVTLNWKDLTVEQLDASQLQLDVEPGALSHELWRGYAPDPRLEKVTNPRFVSIGAGKSSVTLVRRTIIKTPVIALPTKLRWTTFSYFKLDWPRLMPGQRLRAQVRLQGEGGATEFPYALKLTDDPRITALAVPRNSFFASSYSFTGTSREGDLDVLATGDDMTPHFFSSHGPAWVELMPRSGVLRTWGQSIKNYLFLENAVVGGGLMVLSLLWAVFVSVRSDRDAKAGAPAR